MRSTLSEEVVMWTEVTFAHRTSPSPQTPLAPFSFCTQLLTDAVDPAQLVVSEIQRQHLLTYHAGSMNMLSPTFQHGAVDDAEYVGESEHNEWSLRATTCTKGPPCFTSHKGNLDHTGTAWWLCWLTHLPVVMKIATASTSTTA